ncbi:hypothetical protein [Actinoplanes sp. NPDC089786]|uniref:hypothetical protein n=1 Tax=Actinoplanes sp. NPDC089786 TaxID=3155185 RepID=UPI00343FBCDB
MPDPDNCPEFHWNPMAAGASHSQFAGTLAAIVLTAMVVLLSTQRRHANQTYALPLFLTSLFSLTFTAYAFSLVAGIQDCRQAWTLLMAASAGLGVGILGVFGGLSWLIISDGDTETMAYDFTIKIAFVVAAMAVTDVAGTARNLLHILFRTVQYSTVIAVHAAYVAAVMAAFFAVGRNRRKGCRNYPRAVRRAAGSTLGCALAAGLILEVTLATERWNDSTTWISVCASFLGIAIVPVAAVAHLCALPTRSDRVAVLGRLASRGIPPQKKGTDVSDHGNTKRTRRKNRNQTR